jgi:predicted O-methyltransferase YrrM
MMPSTGIKITQIFNKMSYLNWYHQYFDKKHSNSTNEEILDDVFMMLESRGQEYLKHYYESYKQLYINPKEDIVNSKPQVIQQVKEELYDFLNLILNHKVKKILQIGLGHFGSTQFCLNLICDKIVTVEYDSKNISNYSDREKLYNQNKEIFIYGDSTDENIIKQVADLGLFDCVFIDGNHSYEYVKKDYENYSKLVKEGGIIAFHDAKLDAERYGTPKVLNEINKNFNIIDYSNEVGIAYTFK